MNYTEIYNKKLKEVEKQYKVFDHVNTNPASIFSDEFSNVMKKHHNAFYRLLTDEREITVHDIQSFYMKRAEKAFQVWLSDNYHEQSNRLKVSCQTMAYPSRYRFKNENGEEIIRFDIYSKEYVDGRRHKTKSNLNNCMLSMIEAEKIHLEELQTDLLNLDTTIKNPFKAAVEKGSILIRIKALMLACSSKNRKMYYKNKQDYITNRQNHLEYYIKERLKNIKDLEKDLDIALSNFDKIQKQVDIIKEFLSLHNYRLVEKNGFY